MTKDDKPQQEFNQLVDGLLTERVRPALGTLMMQMTQWASRNDVPLAALNTALVVGLSEAQAARAIADDAAPVKYWRSLAQMAFDRSFAQAEEEEAKAPRSVIPSKATGAKLSVVPSMNPGAEVVPANAAAEARTFPPGRKKGG